MEITYNGLSTNNALLTFCDVPNILKLKQVIGGRKCIYNFIVNTPFQSTVVSDGQYYITFLDETITNVMNPKNAINKKFYIAPDTTSTAASIAQALRCCPSIVAQFNVTETLTSKSASEGVNVGATGTMWYSASVMSLATSPSYATTFNVQLWLISIPSPLSYTVEDFVGLLPLVV